MFGTILMVGAAIALTDDSKERKEMQHWSIQKLHAYAGVRSHPKELKRYAYELAKQKKFEQFK